jgi:hypothetical protein
MPPVYYLKKAKLFVPTLKKSKTYRLLLIEGEGKNDFRLYKY